MTKKRNPIISFSLSLLVGGLGQVYNTQMKKGLILFLIPYLILILVSLTGIQFNFIGFVGILVFLLVYRLFVATEACATAYRKKHVALKKYNKKTIYIVLFIISIIFSSLVETRDLLGVKYTILSGNSMEPNISDGERLIINKRVNEFKKGDIIVFKYNDVEFLKRIVGTSGDTVEIANESLYINSEVYKESYMTSPLIRSYQKVTVPEDHVFVLGDNRENSRDSRDIGSVNIKDIIGKAEFIIFSFSPNIVENL